MLNTSGMTYTVPMVTELKYVRCRNSRRMPEHPTHVGTPDPQLIWKLAVGLWSSGMTRTMNSQVSKVLRLLTLSRTSDPRNSWHMSGLPTHNSSKTTETEKCTPQIPDTSGMHIGHVRYAWVLCRELESLVSLTQTSHRLAWALMNNHLSTWCVPLNSTSFL